MRDGPVLLLALEKSLMCREALRAMKSRRPEREREQRVLIK